MEQRSEVGQALNKLQAVRQQNSRLALMAKPVAVRKGGFLGWLQKLALQTGGRHTLWRGSLLRSAALTISGMLRSPAEQAPRHRR
jgi:hypothetical protein